MSYRAIISVLAILCLCIPARAIGLEIALPDANAETGASMVWRNNVTGKTLHLASGWKSTDFIEKPSKEYALYSAFHKDNVTIKVRALKNVSLKAPWICCGGYAVKAHSVEESRNGMRLLTSKICVIGTQVCQSGWRVEQNNLLWEITITTDRENSEPDEASLFMLDQILSTLDSSNV